jgi:hypothetical protein
MNKQCALIALFSFALALPAYAGKKHIPRNPLTPPAPIVQSGDDDNDVLAVLAAAGITYWVMHRRAKRRAPPPPVTVVPPVCPEPDVRIERVLEACVAK